ncbi:spermine synthase [Pelagicoccus sp. SDUM812003]|uniref:spermidine synthase n=1 Tax=Pelagicoccus sp. SDUM812003 TaxID=3041267 RepID=UPI00280E0F96|nr:spermine synthase [Pelagicoccus sp. SDUM812003]MDQ8202714.1 spermine synthase [Pelagicoccus sp. SDUM812003]
MKPRIKLAETSLESGNILALYEQDGAYSINYRGQELMHSKASASEVLLGQLGAAGLPAAEPSRTLVGGLGLGFTLRALLEAAPSESQIEVWELAPEVIEWNRQHLKSLNGRCLDDPRVRVETGDVAPVIRKAAPATYDCILLDVDNGPAPMVASGNASLYSPSGLRQLKASLKPNGQAIFWSAGPDERFALKLKKAGFVTQEIPAKVYEGAKRAAYRLYQARKA